jgi:hypothetical protein
MIDLPEIKIDRISPLEKQYSLASKEVYTKRVEIKMPVVVRQKAKSIIMLTTRKNAK